MLKKMRLIITCLFSLYLLPWAYAEMNLSKMESAIRVAQWALPAVSIAAIGESVQRDLAANENDIIFMSAPMEARHSFLTANNQTPYVLMIINTRQYPIVIDVPPASKDALFFGTVVNAWQVPLADFGPQGEDLGRGGKFLILPPNYQGAVPEGYIVVRSTSYRNYIALRPVSLSGGSLQQTVEYSKTLRMYPLSQAQASNHYNNFVDAYPKAWDSLPVYDENFFRLIEEVIAEEPLQDFDQPVMADLKKLGFAINGKNKNQWSKNKTFFRQAAKTAFARWQKDFLTPGLAVTPFWEKSAWGNFNLPVDVAKEGFTYLRDGKLLIEERANTFFWATFAPKKLGKSTFYISTLWDQQGQVLDGKSTYRLRIPAQVPAEQFWSVIAYSQVTKSFISTAEKVGLSSYDKKILQVNDDGTVDLYFSPHAPEGKESNWLPTREPFFLMMRFYGPKPELFNKTWRLPDLEKISQP